MNLRKVFVVFIALIAFISPVNAGSGDDNDASSPEVGVEWVTDYTYPYSDLPNSGTSANAFYNRLGTEGWTQKFNNGNSNAKAEHFESSGSDSTYIDGVDIAFYQGHGSTNKLDISAVSEKVYWYEAEWGDYDLEWIGLHACEVLQEDYFADALNGVHLICGFSTSAYNYAEDGGAWADFLIDDGNDDAYPVLSSWFYGLDIKQPAGVQLKVFGENANCGNDFIWGQGPVISDPPVDNIYSEWTHDCN